MRYLRMLSNSVIAAGVASGYLTALVLQLNPSVSIDPGTLLPLALVLGVAYGANLTVLFYALIVLRQILAVEVLSPGWLSVRLLSWLCTIAAGTGAALMWLNLRSFGDVLEFMLAGSTAVQIGTQNFVDPFVWTKVLDSLKDYMTRHNVARLSDLIGAFDPTPPKATHP